MLKLKLGFKKLSQAIKLFFASVASIVKHTYGFVIGCVGVASATYGTYLVCEPAAYIVCGLFLLLHSREVAKFQAHIKAKRGR
tara:strand:+ start:5284 stop:5532 length:249 start_codon:yes stop_codon:yes gene_type:complete